MSAWPLVALIALASQTGEPPPDSKTFDVGFGDEEEQVEDDEPLPLGDPEPEAEAEVEVEAEVEAEIAVEPKVEPVPEPEPPPPVLVAPPPTGPSTMVVLIPTDPVQLERGRRVGAAASRLLAARRGETAAVLADRIDPNAASAAASAIARSKDTIAKGVRAFEELDLEQSGALLDVGVNELLAYERVLNEADEKALSKAIFAYAATVLFEGQSELADAIFVALALKAPDFQPASNRYPSNVLQRFTEISAELNSRPSGTLRVETIPAGASVHVDGTFRGYAPLDVGGLADGWHIVNVDRLGYRPFGALAPVPGERSSTIELELEPSAAIERVRGLDPAMTGDVEQIRSLASALGVDSLAVLRYMTPMSGDQVEGIFVPRTGDPIRLAATAISSDPEIAAKTIASALFRAKTIAVVPTLAVADQANPPITKTWWFWAAVTGAALVAAAGTAMVVASANDDGPPSNRGVVLGF